MKYLARDVQSFSLMIREQYIYDLYATKDRYHFLSRPRRFGKSLLISTLKELFQGNRELFKGLWIDESDFPFAKHPVIHLDFSSIAHRSAHDLEISIHARLDECAQLYAIDLGGLITFEDKLNRLIPRLADSNPVVLLVDEYDHPLLKHITDTQVAEDCQQILKSFYDGIKALDGYFRAILITGVSKFSKTSIFSGLNTLQDISEHPKFACLLGYTESEIKFYFQEALADFMLKKNRTEAELLEEMKKWYNGYRFSIEDIRIYNPFSLIYYLKDQYLANYWFASGTTSFLVEILKENPTLLVGIEDQIISASSLGSFDIGCMPDITLFYQTGYLTIKSYERMCETDTFTLGFPNEEVKRSLSILMMGVLTYREKAVVEGYLFSLRIGLFRNDMDTFCTVIKHIFANIPYHLHGENEAYYHSILQNTVYLMGFDAQSELLTGTGRIDMVIKTKQRTFIFEFKFNKTADKALEQIVERRYAEKFLPASVDVTLVGISFNYKDKSFSLDCKKKDIPAHCLIEQGN